MFSPAPERPEPAGRRRESGVHLNISVQERKLSFTQLVPGLETRQESWLLDLEVSSELSQNKIKQKYILQDNARRDEEEENGGGDDMDEMTMPNPGKWLQG